jgi:hypothetical protein
MTMQVGMIGRDGIVLAGDTKWTTQVVRGARKYQDSRHASKIKIDGGVAICCARDMECAPRVADAILSAGSSGESGNFQWIVEAVSPLMGEVGERAWECLVAISAPRPQFVCVFNVFMTDGTSSPRWQLFVHPALRHALAGDDTNDARFWMGHYDPTLSVAELMTLAAYLVVDARQFNNAMIGGLEIAYSHGSDFVRVSDDRCLAIEAEVLRSAQEIKQVVTRAQEGI